MWYFLLKTVFSNITFVIFNLKKQHWNTLHTYMIAVRYSRAADTVAHLLFFFEFSAPTQETY